MHYSHLPHSYPSLCLLPFIPPVLASHSSSSSITLSLSLLIPSPTSYPFIPHSVRARIITSWSDLLHQHYMFSRHVSVLHCHRFVTDWLNDWLTASALQQLSPRLIYPILSLYQPYTTLDKSYHYPLPITTHLILILPYPYHNLQETCKLLLPMPLPTPALLPSCRFIPFLHILRLAFIWRWCKSLVRPVLYDVSIAYNIQSYKPTNILLYNEDWWRCCDKHKRKQS